MQVFDRRAVQAHRNRAASNLAAHDFLFREAADRLADRLLDCRRDFPLALDIGSHGGILAEVLGSRGGVQTLVQADLSPRLAAQGSGLRLAADEEYLPFALKSFDLVMSALSLHWVNDLPGALIQLRRCLKPDGLFVATILGGDSLWELRESLLRAEAEIEGGASPRISPFAELADGASLLQRAGFALPVADGEQLTVTYPDALTLMRELRGMGENNAGVDRRRNFSRRTTLLRAAEIYRERFGDRNGRIPATFQFITLTGWRPHPSQPRALRPGSAKTRLADALGTVERPTGEKPGA